MKSVNYIEISKPEMLGILSAHLRETFKNNLLTVERIDVECPESQLIYRLTVKEMEASHVS